MVRKIKVKLVLRLRAEGLTGRQIAAQGMSRTSVAMVLDAADRESISWDDVAELDEADVYARLFPGAVSTRVSTRSRIGTRSTGSSPGLG